MSHVGIEHGKRFLLPNFKFEYSCAHSVHESELIDMHRSKVTQRKIWNDCVPVCEQGKIPRELRLVKRVNNFTQAQLNRNQDFVVPVLDSFRASVSRSMQAPRTRLSRKKIYIHSHASLPAQVCFSTSRRRDDETYLQDRLKQWISFSHALIGCSDSGYAVKFTSMRPQTRVNYEQNGFPVYCRNKRRNLTKKLKKLFPEKHEEGDELWFVRGKICLFN